MKSFFKISIVRVFIGILRAPQYKIPSNNEHRSPCLPFGRSVSNRERGLITVSLSDPHKFHYISLHEKKNTPNLPIEIPRKSPDQNPSKIPIDSPAAASRPGHVPRGPRPQLRDGRVHLAGLGWTGPAGHGAVHSHATASGYVKIAIENGHG